MVRPILSQIERVALETALCRRLLSITLQERRCPMSELLLALDPQQHSIRATAQWPADRPAGRWCRCGADARRPRARAAPCWKGMGAHHGAGRRCSSCWSSAPQHRQIARRLLPLCLKDDDQNMHRTSHIHSDSNHPLQAHLASQHHGRGRRSKRVGGGALCCQLTCCSLACSGGPSISEPSSTRTPRAQAGRCHSSERRCSKSRKPGSSGCHAVMTT